MVTYSFFPIKATAVRSIQVAMMWRKSILKAIYGCIIHTLTWVPWKHSYARQLSRQAGSDLGLSWSIQGPWLRPSHPASLSFHLSVYVCMLLCAGFRLTSCFPGHSTSLQAGHTPTCDETKQCSFLPVMFLFILLHHKIVYTVSKNTQLAEESRWGSFVTFFSVSPPPPTSVWICFSVDGLLNRQYDLDWTLMGGDFQFDPRLKRHHIFTVTATVGRMQRL